MSTDKFVELSNIPLTLPSPQRGEGRVRG